jgi:hypothetical protein
MNKICIRTVLGEQLPMGAAFNQLAMSNTRMRSAAATVLRRCTTTIVVHQGALFSHLS